MITTKLISNADGQTHFFREFIVKVEWRDCGLHKFTKLCFSHLTCAISTTVSERGHILLEI